MAKYPKINYIGNKSKIVDWIIDCLPVKNGIVVDLFSGGSSISYAFKQKGFKVVGNDALYSDFIIHKSIIENNYETLSFADINQNINEEDIALKYNEISKYLTNILYFDDEVKELAKIICIAEKLDSYKKYLLLALIRRAMIRKLPYSRMNIPWNQIQKLRDEKYSYEKYGRKRAYHNRTFTDLIIADLQNYNDAIFDNGQNNISYHMDAYDFINNLNQSVDIIYMDPPYPHTMNRYGDFYGLYDVIFNKSIKYKNLSENDKFLNNFIDIIKMCIPKTKYIAISLNNKTQPSIEDIQNKIKDYGDVQILEKSHQYKVTNKENKNSTIEQLLILKIKK